MPNVAGTTNSPGPNPIPLRLAVHPTTFSPEHVLLNLSSFSDPKIPDGCGLALFLDPSNNDEDNPENGHDHGSDPARGPPPKAFIFVAHDMSPELKARHPHLLISISEQLAALHGFHNRMPALLARADLHKNSASHVELMIRDYLDRADLWTMSTAELRRRGAIYQGQTLNFLGNINITIQRIYNNGQKVPSALFADDSKPIFRSASARFLVAVQLSSEMWDFDGPLRGQIYWHRALAFLSSLIDRWHAINASHKITILFFTRIAAQDDKANNISDTAESPQETLRDFYRIVISERLSSDCRGIDRRLSIEFRDFLKVVSQSFAYDNAAGARVRPVPSKDGNILETINLAASSCLHDDTDTDFLISGTQIVIITPGSGIFNVDESLMRVTHERLISRSTGVDLVCLSPVPLHSAPLFIFTSGPNVVRDDSVADREHTSLTQGQSSIDAPSSRIDGRPPDDLDFGPEVVKVIPHWVELSHFSGAFDTDDMSMHDGRKVRGKDITSEAYRLPLEVPISSYSVERTLFPSLEGVYPIRTDGEQDSKAVLHGSGSPNATDRHPVDPKLKSAIFLHVTAFDSGVFKTNSAGLASDQKRVLLHRAKSRQSVHSLSQEPGAAPRDGNTVTGADGLLTSRIKPRRDVSKRTFSGKSSIASLLGGRGIGKARATTSPSTEVARSSPSVASASQVNHDVDGFTGQVRGSLSRTPSIFSMTSEAQPSSPMPIVQSHSRPTTTSSELSGDQLNDRDRLASAAAKGSSPTDIFKASSYSRKSIPNGSMHKEYGLKSQPVGENLTPRRPWLIVTNPSRLMTGVDASFGQWDHVVTRRNHSSAVRWKAMTSPASLPLTTEECPSISDLRVHFTESPYKLAVSEAEDQPNETSLRRCRLARELVRSRLSQGFQIAIGPRANELTGAHALSTSDPFADDFMSEDGAALLMVKGDCVHLMCASGCEIAITRFRPKAPLPELPPYYAMIRTLLEKQYTSRQFSFAILKERNWNILDHQVASHEQEVLENASSAPITIIHRRTARFVLVPVDTPKTSKPMQHDDSEEETRIEGIRKLTALWQKHRYVTPDEERHQASWVGHMDPNPLAIEYQTRDPSAVVAAGMEGTTFLEGATTVAATQLFSESEMYRTSHVDLQRLAADLQGEKGIKVRDRRWHFRLYQYCFVGVELTSFLLANFQDLKSREDAVEFGNVLLKKGLFQHVHKKHQFRDGQYFYTISPDYRVPRSEQKTWYGGRRVDRSVPATPLSEASKEVNLEAEVDPFTAKRHKVSLSSSMQYNVDPRKVSGRPEVVTIHYDRLHNPENAFHFQLEWDNATARLIEDALISWAIAINRHGLKLVQVPRVEVTTMSEINPLRSPYSIEMALKSHNTPIRSIVDSPLLSPQHTSGPIVFQKALLKKLDYVLDFEAASNFPADVDVTYSWGRPEHRHDQYIHKSGLLLIEIAGDWKFLLLANRMYNDLVNISRSNIHRDKPSSNAYRDDQRSVSVSALASQHRTALAHHTSSPAASPLVRPVPEREPPAHRAPKVLAERLKDEFEAFCHDVDALRELYDTVLQQRSSIASPKSTPALSAVSAAATPSLLSSIPSLELPGDSDGEELQLSALDPVDADHASERGGQRNE